MRITIESSRLILRPFETFDAQSMYDNWASDPEVSKYVAWNTHASVEVTKQIVNLWIEQYQKPERINFAITLKETGELIGGIDVVGYLDGIPVIGYVLSRKYWNNGYMTEACKRVVEYLFTLGHKTIIIDAVKENIASNKVIEKCGGVYQETYQEYFKQKNKTYSINRYLIKK